MFAKYWRPGAVKTRLAAAIGDVAAAEVYRRFIVTLLARLDGVAERQQLCYWPDESAAEFQALPLDTWQLVPQSSGDLGARMRHYFEAAFAAGSRRVVLIGSDSPDLPLEYISRAFEQLQSHAVVLGPSDDGGYYLVGAAGGVPPIFDGVEWSSPRVWAQTLAALSAAGMKHFELPPWYDVDELADLQRLSLHLAASRELDEPLWKLAEFLKANVKCKMENETGKM